MKSASRSPSAPAAARARRISSRAPSPTIVFTASSGGAVDADAGEGRLQRARDVGRGVDERPVEVEDHQIDVRHGARLVYPAATWCGVAQVARRRAATSMRGAPGAGGGAPSARRTSAGATRSNRSTIASGMKRVRGVNTWRSPRRCCWRMKKRSGWIDGEEVLRARHRDVEQAALLLDLGGRAGRQVRRDAAVGGGQHEHAVPFLALRRVDRRQDQVVLVEVRRRRLGAGRRPAGPASGRTGSARATAPPPRAAPAARDRPGASRASS